MVGYWDFAGMCWRELIRMHISGGLIRKIKRGQAFEWDCQSLDGYIVPGLVDSHVHLGGSTTRGEFQVSMAREAVEKRIRRNCTTAINSGITSLRDTGGLGDDWEAVLRWLRKEAPTGIKWPRVFSAGTYLTARGGHLANGGLHAENQQELSKCLAHLFQNRVDFVKVMNDPVVFDQSMLARMAEDCALERLPLAIHAYTDQAALMAAAVTGSSVEHFGGYAEPTLQRLVARGMNVVTTLIAAFDTVSDLSGTFSELLIPDANPALFKGWYLGCIRSFPQAHRQGLGFVLGTDAGFPGTEFDSLHREMALVDMLGMHPIETLAASTLVAGQLLQRPVGEIREGRFADCLFTIDNPLTDLSLLRRPEAVFVGGRAALDDQTPISSIEDRWEVES